MCVWHESLCPRGLAVTLGVRISCLEGIFGCICLNTDVIVCFVGLQFADHLTFAIFTLGFRRILLKHHFGGKNAYSGRLILFFVCLLHLQNTASTSKPTRVARWRTERSMWSPKEVGMFFQTPEESPLLQGWNIQRYYTYVALCTIGQDLFPCL
jgi:hypothetical protein